MMMCWRIRVRLWPVKLTSVFKKGRKKIPAKNRSITFYEQILRQTLRRSPGFYEWNSSQLKNSNEILMHFLKGSKTERVSKSSPRGGGENDPHSYIIDNNDSQMCVIFWHSEDLSCDIFEN